VLIVCFIRLLSISPNGEDGGQSDILNIWRAQEELKQKCSLESVIFFNRLTADARE
jgi:hypothetical protein